MTQPLTDVAVVVTRPREQAGSLIVRLQDVGADVIALPLISIKPRPEPWSSAEIAAVTDADTIVVTSANGARLLAEALSSGGLPSLPATATIAAVGPATARELRRHGLAAQLVPDQATGRDLVTALAGQGLASGRRIVLARARSGNPALADGLRRSGATVTELPLYTTLPLTPDSSALQEAARAQFWTFHSPSAVDAAVATLGDRLLAEKTIVVVGPTTAARIGDHHLRVAAQADAPTDEAVAHAVVSVARAARATN